MGAWRTPSQAPKPACGDLSVPHPPSASLATLVRLHSLVAVAPLSCSAGHFRPVPLSFSLCVDHLPAGHGPCQSEPWLQPVRARSCALSACQLPVLPCVSFMLPHHALNAGDPGHSDRGGSSHSAQGHSLELPESPPPGFPLGSEAASADMAVATGVLWEAGGAPTSCHGCWSP